MAIKEIKREWSPCQLDYVKTFLLHSEKELKDLPKCCIGSKAIVSETDNEYFCTESGWKLGSELGGGGEVVILPETELTHEDGSWMIPTPLSATPTEGKTCTVTCNGVAYDCPVFNYPGAPVTAFVMGATKEMGLPGGNDDAPFVVMLLPGGDNGIYGMCMYDGEVDSITLSIVQTEGAESGGDAGGGIFEVNVPVTNYIASTGHDFGEFDKTFAELLAAHKAGKYVRINVGWDIGYSTYGYVIGFGKSNGQDTLIVSMPASPTMPKQVAVYMLYAGDDGKIAAQIMGSD